MSRVWLMSIVLVSVIVPSVAQAQGYELPTCTDPAVMSRSSYGRAVPCVPLVPVPPTGVPEWLRPVPIPQPALLAPPPLSPPPVYVAPPSVYIAPTPTPRTPIDPWIPLAVRPAPTTNTLDLLTQMLVLQELAAARRQYTAPAPVMPAPAPMPSSMPGDGWMSGFIKGVKK